MTHHPLFNPQPESVHACPQCASSVASWDQRCYSCGQENKHYNPADAPSCHFCGGSGEVDSGGVEPWGAGINRPCPVCSKPDKASDDDEAKSILREFVASWDGRGFYDTSHEDRIERARKVLKP